MNNIIYIINFLKKNGYIFQTSELIGGLKSCWDYGPYGLLLKNKIKKLWIQKFIDEQNNLLIEANFLQNPNTWKISKHLETFQNYYLDCYDCKHRFSVENNLNLKFKLSCPYCSSNNLSKNRKFNLLFETKYDVFENLNNKKIFLRPELAQGIFSNFINTINSTRKQIPFGIGQIGISLRNEITTNLFLYKTKAFEQMELEFFVNSEDETYWFKYYQNLIQNFLINDLHLKKLKIKNVPKNKLAHYSKKTVDFLFPFFKNKKYGELCGLANRGNYDLTQWSKFVNKSIKCYDNKTKKFIIPSVIEPSFGVDRLFFAIILQFYKSNNSIDKKLFREWLELPYMLSPYIFAINPLTNRLIDVAKSIFDLLKQQYSCIFMSKGSIGKRYYIQDSIGIRFNITIDYEYKETKLITIRDRNTTKQIKLKITEIFEYLKTFQNE